MADDKPVESNPPPAAPKPEAPPADPRQNPTDRVDFDDRRRGIRTTDERRGRKV